MRIEVYQATNAMDVPEKVFWTFDGLDDRYIAAFENYPDAVKIVVVAWGTTGEVDGEPLAVLVATAGHIITGFVDSDFDAEIDPEEYLADFGEPLEPGDLIEHNEPDPTKRARALLARLRAVRPTDWLLVHDADFVDSWVMLGFKVVPPPADVPSDDAVNVLVWGTPPEDVYAVFRARKLSWDRNVHRGFRPEEPLVP
jgi:hypothetical protein